VTNDELWDRVRAPQGSLVRDGSGLRTLYVVRVLADVVVVRARQTYHLPRSTLEAAYPLGRNSHALLPEEVSRARLDHFDPTLLIGVLNAIGADRE
jgi:hypothetical protein